MKKFLTLVFLPLLFGCAELQQIADSLPQEGTGISNAEVAAGLRQALDFGIDKQVTKLAQEDDPEVRQKILNATLDDVVGMAEKDRTTLCVFLLNYLDMST